MPEDLASEDSVAAALTVQSVGGLVFLFRMVCDPPNWETEAGEQPGRATQRRGVVTQSQPVHGQKRERGLSTASWFEVCSNPC